VIRPGTASSQAQLVRRSTAPSTSTRDDTMARVLFTVFVSVAAVFGLSMLFIADSNQRPVVAATEKAPISYVERGWYACDDMGPWFRWFMLDKRRVSMETEEKALHDACRKTERDEPIYAIVAEQEVTDRDPYRQKNTSIPFRCVAFRADDNNKCQWVMLDAFEKR
jgi:hypothetical protein